MCRGIMGDGTGTIYTFESKLDTLTNSMLKMSDSLARLTRPHGALLNSEEEDALLEEGGQSEFDPTERILSEETNLESGDLPYEDLFKDTEDCGLKVNEGVAKRVNSACTIDCTIAHNAATHPGLLCDFRA